MTPLMSWAAVLVGWVAVLAVGAVITAAVIWVSAAIRVARCPWRARPRPTLDEVNGWPWPRRDAWMRHPMHTERCRCGRYGMPFGPQIEVLGRERDTIRHGADQCQPDRESL